ncbi:MAG: 50S ribosomal protein L3 [Candidatus Micrarchaeia archaeon]
MHRGSHRGSLQYWPHRRASRILPRLRSKHDSKTFELTNLIGFKVGMTHVSVIEDPSAQQAKEKSSPCTVIELPKQIVYGLRLYKIDGKTGYLKSSLAIYSRQAAEKLGMKSIKNDESAIDKIKQNLSEYADARLLVAADPKPLSVGIHHVIKYEIPLNGESVSSKFEAAVLLLGKEIKFSDVFKPGEYVDVLSISKGKGWQGPIKRFGVTRQYRKSTEKIRHVGNLGPMRPGKVFFTVPQAGQLGFNYRTERNKKIFAVNPSVNINPKSGFTNYGLVKGDFILLKGSVPGAIKRLVRIRKSIQNKNAHGIKEPKIIDISVQSR